MHDQIYANICQIIGKTPVVRLNRIPKNFWAELLVKLESFNPGGSVKDRIGLSMIEAARTSVKLTGPPGGKQLVVQVTLPAGLLQAQPAGGVTLTYDIPAGMATVHVASRAVLGPALVTPMV